MALSSALMNKGDYEYRKANLTLRQMAIADEIQRKEEAIKDIESDFTRCENAAKKWDNAYKDDQGKTKSGEAEVTAARANVLKSSDWNFATNVGVKIDETTRKVLLSPTGGAINQYSHCEFGDNPFSAERQTYLAQLQSEQSQLEMEQDSIDSQLETVNGMIDGLKGLVSNAAQDNTFWAVGG